jgi:hypothetical protein
MRILIQNFCLIADPDPNKVSSVNLIATFLGNFKYRNFFLFQLFLLSGGPINQKDIFTNIKKINQNLLQFIHLDPDPDPAPQINADPEPWLFDTSSYL